jgi:hypothetical protein
VLPQAPPRRGRLEEERKSAPCPASEGRIGGDDESCRVGEEVLVGGDGSDAEGEGSNEGVECVHHGCGDYDEWKGGWRV